jgi:nitroimidazol reductase NimA-like FMN-containing flavoprotein (pyridoxamine 5'-phosphate oxidase superfamily)
METRENELIQSRIQEMTTEEMYAVLKEHYLGSLSYISQRHPFVIPITFFYDDRSECLLGYSAEGHKIDAMRNSPQVSLMIYQLEDLTRWKSVMVQGEFEELHQIDAKAGLHRFTEGIREQIAPRNERAKIFIEDFSSSLKNQGVPIVFRIRINGLTGKKRLH